LVAAGETAAGCSETESDRPDPARADAAPEAASRDEATVEATTPLRDAGTVDAAPLPVTCTSAPCATALVTTLGASIDDRGEGFCALLADRTVACWGANGAAQLGRGDDAGTNDSATAARVDGLSRVVSLDHTCAVDEDAAVWCWGTGPFLRSDGGVVTTARTPVRLDLPPVAKIGVGHSSACAAVSGGVLCWGDNADAQLGLVTTASGGAEQPTLVRVPSGAAIRAVAVGRAVFVLREDGTLVTWGGNPPLGRLSPIFPDPNPEPVALAGVVSTDLVYDDACATAGGRGYCWGAALPRAASELDRGLPEPVVTPEPIVQIATTRTQVIENIGVQRYRWCASAVSGAVYCWGLNESGQAGDGTLNYAFDAVKVEGLPERAAQVKTTPNTTCALLTNGKVYCWGSNYNGQLGNGQNRGRSLAPVEVVFP